MKKNILIPTDFSSTARDAMKYAVNLLGREHTYVLFNAYEEPHASAGSIISLKKILSESSEEALREEVEYVRSAMGFNDLDLKVVSEYGGPAQALNAYADSNKVDMIAIGTTGASGLKDIMIGSVASSVLKSASCPVLAVPSGVAYYPLKHILLAADLRGKSNEESLSIFFELARQHQSKVTILTVVPPGTDLDLERTDRGFDLDGMLSDIDHEFEVVDGDDIEETILNEAHDRKANLVVAVHRKSSWFSRLVNPSISGRLAKHIDLPLLTFTEAS